MHFPLPVVRRRRHPFNAVRVTLVAQAGGGPRQRAVALGTLGFHLHELAEAGRVNGPFALFKGHHETGTLVMGIEFCYGAFGFGRGPRIVGQAGPTGESVPGGFGFFGFWLFFFFTFFFFFVLGRDYFH
jgi:hypothetical protein